jgi:hypothetical protein
MTWKQAKETALTATLFAVLLLLYAHILYYLQHSQP